MSYENASTTENGMVGRYDGGGSTFLFLPGIWQKDSLAVKIYPPRTSSIWDERQTEPCDKN